MVLDHHVPDIATAYKKAMQYAQHITHEMLCEQIRSGNMEVYGVNVVIQKQDPVPVPTARTLRRSL